MERPYALSNGCLAHVSVGCQLISGPQYVKNGPLRCNRSLMEALACA